MIADVYAVIGVLDLKLVRSGSKEVRVACPAHADKTGNTRSIGDFYLNVNSGKSQCFSCGFQSTSVLTLGAYVTGLDIWSVMRMYREADAIDISQIEVVGDSSSPSRGSDVQILATNPEISEAELVLFDDVPDPLREFRHLEVDALDAYGVRWDAEKKAWVLPLYDTDERFQGYQLRKKGWERNQPDGIPKSKLIFGAPLVVPDDETPVVVTESPLDAIRAWQVGYVGVSTMGASFSDEQAKWLVASDRIMIAAFDQDRAGRDAANRLRSNYGRRFGSRLKFVHYISEHKDIGDMPTDELVLRTLANTSSLVQAA